MSQDSHAVAEPLRFEMIDNDQKYRVHSKAAILSLFRSMMRSKSLITCYFDHGNRFILTTVIDVNAEQGKMVLDYGTDEESCRLALKAERLNVVGFLDQVRIQFVCEGLGKICSGSMTLSLLRFRKHCCACRKESLTASTSQSVLP